MPDLPTGTITLLFTDQAVATARNQSGQDAFARAWSQGRTTTLEQVFSFRPG